MSWAAHEFENYFIQKHVGLKASFLGITFGAMTPDLFTKFWVYRADDPARFHRGWPGVGPTHSLLWGAVLGVLVLAVTKSRSWGLGVLIGQWAHVLTDFCDTAGTMPFFPFSTEQVTISMWKHAASEGRYGDATGYYSSLGGVWDAFWLVVVVAFAWKTFKPSYFRNVIIPADPRVWGWMHRTLRLPREGLILVYWGIMFYGAGRLVAWFTYTRTQTDADFDASWGGPYWVAGNDLSDAGWGEVLLDSAIGAVGLAVFLFVCWRLFIGRLWQRGYDPPQVDRGRGLRAVFGETPG